MPAKTNSIKYEDWYLHGGRDLQSAKILLKSKGSSENIAFFLQQAAEKYLKGYLIKQGWKLKKIHDLEVLLSEASRHNESFKAYLDSARLMSAAYIESRYPLGPPKEYSIELVSEWLEQTETLIALIKIETK